MREGPGQCRTDGRRRLGDRVAPALVPILLATAVAGTAWPDFLAPPAAYSSAEADAIRRAWTSPTLHRAVEGPAAPMPLAAYLALIEAPDVTAAAARHLGLAHYEVRLIGPDWYEADDHDGARGVYRVIERRDTPQLAMRVTLSWGRRHGPLLGTISGSALTMMEFEAHGAETLQRLDTYVVIDNAVIGRLARALVAIFGRIADGKLAHGFAVSAQVAAWARQQPDEFCAWLHRQPLDAARRARLQELAGGCGGMPQPARSVAR